MTGVPIHRVSAYNTSKHSENKIHDDTVARKYGFAGGLVPGVDVMAYMLHMPVARWGRDFLERGLIRDADEKRRHREGGSGRIGEEGGEAAPSENGEPEVELQTRRWRDRNLAIGDIIALHLVMRTLAGAVCADIDLNLCHRPAASRSPRVTDREVIHLTPWRSDAPIFPRASGAG